MAIDYRPFELRPYPEPTLRADSDYLKRAWAKSVYPAAERMKVTMKQPTVDPQPHTRLAFEGMYFAAGQGKAGEYNTAVMQAFFQRSEDIGKLAVLAKLAAGVGLPEAEFTEALESGAYTAKHKVLVEGARQFVNVVPTFIIGQQRVEGLYPVELLEQLIDDELRRVQAG